MTIFRNRSINSSATDVRIESSSGGGGGGDGDDYGNLTYANNTYKNAQENHYNNNNNNNNHLHSVVDYVTIPRGSSGQSTYLFWTLVVVLFVLAFGNLILTFVILGVLRLGQGMESLELVPEESLVKFYGDTDLDNVYKRDGKLEGFGESPMEITGDGGGGLRVSISDAATEDARPTMDIAARSSSVRNVRGFEVRDPTSGKPLFSTDFPNFGLPSGVDKLDVKVALAKRVASPVDESLLVKSDSFIKLKGSEGVHVDGREIVWSADRDIFLKSVNRSLVLDGRDGVFIDVKTIPLASGIRELSPNPQYKLCVCMPNGKLFRVAVSPRHAYNHDCHSVDMSPEHNPCI